MLPDAIDPYASSGLDCGTSASAKADRDSSIAMQAATRFQSDLRGVHHTTELAAPIGATPHAAIQPCAHSDSDNVPVAKLANSTRDSAGQADGDASPSGHDILSFQAVWDDVAPDTADDVSPSRFGPAKPDPAATGIARATQKHAYGSASAAAAETATRAWPDGDAQAAARPALASVQLAERLHLSGHALSRTCAARDSTRAGEQFCDRAQADAGARAAAHVQPALEGSVAQLDSTTLGGMGAVAGRHDDAAAAPGVDAETRKDADGPVMAAQETET